jgi:hypothetical protein
MKTRRIFILIVSVVLLAMLLTTGFAWARGTFQEPTNPEASVGTGFTYQGYLTDKGSPADGTYDFGFYLWDDETAGATPLWEIFLEDIEVNQGLFTVVLDFGSGVFDGEERWLEIGVRPYTETGTYTILGDRQPINPTPYALYAVEAGNVAWTDVTGLPKLRPVFSRSALDSDGYVGDHTSSITIGADGLPIISYYDDTNDDLKTAHCVDMSCISAITSTLDSIGDVGRHTTSITIGRDGLPVISYFDNTNYDLKAAHCNDTACTSASSQTLDNGGQVGYYSSITIGSDGLPVISYYDAANYDLKAAHCDDTACTSASIQILESTGEVGEYTAITIGSDGMPVISYFDTSNDDLKVTHCSNPFCVPYWRRR